MTSGEQFLYYSLCRVRRAILSPDVARRLGTCFGIGLVAFVAFLGGTILWTTTANSQSANCISRHIAYNGNPSGFGLNVVSESPVPEGHRFRVTNASVLAERHSNGVPDAGEFTAVLSVLAPGRVVIAESSLETGNGIAYQGQGQKNVWIEAGDSLEFAYWLRDGKTPSNYFYNVSVSYIDCVH